MVSPTVDLLCRRSNARQAELAAAYERINELEVTLTECQSYFENAADPGQGAPNREMGLLVQIDGVLL